MDWNSCVQTITVQDPGGKTHQEQIASAQCVFPFFRDIISAAFTFAGIVAVIVIILGGIKYTRSKGDPQGLKSAQQTLTWGIIGLLIVMFAFFIVTFIGTITGTSKSCLFQGVLNGTYNLGGCQ